MVLLLLTEENGIEENFVPQVKEARHLFDYQSCDKIQTPEDY